MNNIEIKDVQNVAKNMTVSNKQHSLFQSVQSNNPPLISGGESIPEPTFSGESDAISVSKVEVDVGDKSVSAMSVSKEIDSPASTPGSSMISNLVSRLNDRCGCSTNLNSHLYGVLKPCKKQFMSR
jgi:hypothetical protein